MMCSPTKMLNVTAFVVAFLVLVKAATPLENSNDLECHEGIKVLAGEKKEIFRSTEPQNMTLYAAIGDRFAQLEVKVTLNFNKNQSNIYSREELCLKPTRHYRALTVALTKKPSRQNPCIRVKGLCSACKVLKYQEKFDIINSFQVYATGSSLWRNTTLPSHCPNVDTSVPESATPSKTLVIVIFTMVIVCIVLIIVTCVVALRTYRRYLRAPTQEGGYCGFIYHSCQR
ncbi:hypothetical protein SK128_003185, partial [Halocaridina rubra]